jgi:hypothetical protein
MRQMAGCRGIDCGGKPHLFDAMTILFLLWERDGKHAATSGVVKRCWRKAWMLPVSWDNDINNDVGSESVSIWDKTLSTAPDSQALCGLMRLLQVKADANGGVDTEQHACGLQSSFLDNADALSDTEMEQIAENWTVFEDDPCVIDAEIDEAAIDLLQTEASSDMIDVGDDDEPEAMDVVVEDDSPVLTILEAEAHLDKLLQHSKAKNLPSAMLKSKH